MTFTPDSTISAVISALLRRLVTSARKTPVPGSAIKPELITAVALPAAIASSIIVNPGRPDKETIGFPKGSRP